MMARFIIAAVLIALGIFIFAMATFGIFKFRYVLNRMHVAAQSDTLGLLCVLVGVGILTGFTFATLKLVAIIVFFWMSSPISSHMVAKMEIASQEKDDADEFETIVDEEEEAKRDV